MRLVLTALALVVIASCEQATQPSPPPPTPDHSAAVSRALNAVWASFNGSVLMDAFPRTAGVEACVINIGPPPGRDVAAMCSTAVQREAAVWLVTFIETWDAASFRASGSARTGPLMHTWQFKVDGEGRIVGRVHFGDFPPQLVF